jgi:type IV secretory pathway VirB10-like protein
MKFVALVVVFGIGCLMALGLHAEIYSWTDEKGIKHYSHTPPADRSLRIKTAPEIPNNPTDIHKTEKINEENIETLLEEPDKENKPSAATDSGSQQELSRQQRIDNEKKKLEEKLAYLESLPSDSFANSRSRDVIIGQYRYRLQQLMSNPDDYFSQYGF